MDAPTLEKVTFVFSQEGNTDGTTGLPETDGWEVLTIEMQSGLDSIREKPGYLVVRTPTGWSINDPAELADLLKYVKNIFKLNKWNIIY
jgi:hypothetical protein